MLSEALSIQGKNEHLPGQKEENAITDRMLYTKSQIMNVHIALIKLHKTQCGTRIKYTFQSRKR